MKYLKNLFAALFNVTYIDTSIRICFHKEAIYFGEHGVIKVTNKKMGLVEQDISFVFVGVTTPPPLNLDTYVRIWEEAKNQGYIPHEMVQYGKNNEVFDVERAEYNICMAEPHSIASRNHAVAMKEAASFITSIRN